MTTLQESLKGYKTHLLVLAAIGIQGWQAFTAGDMSPEVATSIVQTAMVSSAKAAWDRFAATK